MESEPGQLDELEVLLSEADLEVLADLLQEISFVPGELVILGREEEPVRAPDPNNSGQDGVHPDPPMVAAELVDGTNEHQQRKPRSYFRSGTMAVFLAPERRTCKPATHGSGWWPKSRVLIDERIYLVYHHLLRRSK